MTIRWRRILPIALLPVLLIAIAFSIYAHSRPTIYCVMVNESLQTTVKASGKRAPLANNPKSFHILVETLKGLSARLLSRERFRQNPQLLSRPVVLP